MKSLDFAKLTFEDMFVNGAPTQMTKENFPKTTISYADINAGLMYSGNWVIMLPVISVILTTTLQIR
jgi:hypothetical protein